MHRVLLIAVPLFALCIALEWWWSRRQGRDSHDLADSLSSLSQGLMSLAVAAVTPLFQTGLYAWTLPHVALLPASTWSGWGAWAAAILVYDFCDYWLHRVSHESAIFWAAHAVHHQSERFNLTTALRQESFYAVMGAPFFLPMALLGMPADLYLGAGLFVLLYQFWIHTELIGRLGWLDRVISTPSNHRVHHAVNPGYLDKNYGAVLVIWDRMFGSFIEETDPCVYGTVKPLRSWSPLRAIGQVYGELFSRARATPRWRDRVRVLFKSPGWAPPGLPPFTPPDEARLKQPRFGSHLQPLDVGRAISLFVVTAAATALWLDVADDLGEGTNLLAAAVVTIGLSATGAMLTRGVNVGTPDSGALSGSDPSPRWEAWGLYLGAIALCAALMVVMAWWSPP